MEKRSTKKPWHLFTPQESSLIIATRRYEVFPNTYTGLSEHRHQGPVLYLPQQERSIRSVAFYTQFKHSIF